MCPFANFNYANITSSLSAQNTSSCFSLSSNPSLSAQKHVPHPSSSHAITIHHINKPKNWFLQKWIHSFLQKYIKHSSKSNQKLFDFLKNTASLISYKTKLNSTSSHQPLLSLSCSNKKSKNKYHRDLKKIRIKKKIIAT